MAPIGRWVHVGHTRGGRYIPAMVAAFQRYVVLERIAVGGMGEVFLARQHGIGGFSRTVVLKRLLPDAEGDDEAMRRLLDEARVAGSLTHENVVSIIEVGEDGGHPFLALEYVHGENAGALRNRARRADADLPVVAVARIVADAARGLHHAHTARNTEGKPLHVVHRDVAPKNIFVRTDGTSKIGDFGIAKSERKLASTATGSVPGTLAYMSPEQMTGERVGPASDQFSLGIVLWELLTGERLFRAQSPARTIENIAKKRVRLPSRLRVDAAPLDAIALRMLDRNISRRFGSLEEAAVAIEEALPDVRTDVGRRAVALLVERLAGNELRARMKKIEEGAEETVRTPRPLFAEEHTPKTPDHSAPMDSAPTVIDRPSARRRPRRRLALVAAAAAAFALTAVGGAFAHRLGADPTDVERTRAYLARATLENALVDREVLLAMASIAHVDPVLADKAIAVTTPLAEQRLALLRAYFAEDDAARERDSGAMHEKERALEAQAKRTLMALGEFGAEALDMWAYDASAPFQWAPPSPLSTLQRYLKDDTFSMMNEQKAMRDQAVDRLMARTGVDQKVGHAELDPLVKQREALIGRFVDAPVGELAGLQEQIDEIEARGRQLLVARYGVAQGGALASLAFFLFPSKGAWEPLFEAMPSMREEKARGDAVAQR